MKYKDIVIVMPAFNESKNIKPLLLIEFIKKEKNLQLILINDGSTDNTLFLLKKIQKKQPENIDIISLEINQGKAEAVRQGILYSLKKYKSTYIGFLDIDLEIPYTQVSKLHKVLQSSSYELAITSRFKDKKVFHSSVFRNIISIVSKKISKFFIKLPFKDTQCGCKLFKTKIIEELFSKHFISRWLFDIEILLRIKNIKKLHLVVEVQLESLEKVETSTIKKSVLFKTFIELLKIYKYY